MKYGEVELFITKPIEEHFYDLNILVSGEFPSADKVFGMDLPSHLLIGNDPLHLEDHAFQVRYWKKVLEKAAEKAQGVVFSPMEISASDNAALLHDIGRNGNEDDENHGERSAILAGEHLRELQFPENEILLTQELIRAHEPRVQVGIFVRSDLIFLIKEADRTQFPRTGKIFDRGRVTYHETLGIIMPAAQALRFETMRNIDRGIPRSESLLLAGKTYGIMP